MSVARRFLSLAAMSVAALGVIAGSPVAADDIAVDLELVLAVDVSGSVDVEEGELQRQGYVTALAHPRVIETIQSGFHGRIAVTYVEWSDTYSRSVVVPWMLVSDAPSAEMLAAKLAAADRTRGLYTSISGVIEYVMPLFSDNGFDSRRRVIDISGDGPNNIGALVTTARDAAVAAGITINGLPIVNDRPDPRGRMPMPNLDLYYRDCVIGGPWSFIVVAEDFRSFADAVRRKLIIEIGGMDPDLPLPHRADIPASPMPAAAVVAALRGPSAWPPVASTAGGTLERLVADNRAAPPCDEGERLRQQRWQQFDPQN